jgi:hypothetical protein
LVGPTDVRFGIVVTFRDLSEVIAAEGPGKRDDTAGR